MTNPPTPQPYKGEKIVITQERVEYEMCDLGKPNSGRHYFHSPYLGYYQMLAAPNQFRPRLGRLVKNLNTNDFEFHY